jgi:hypothetical protein
MKESLNLAAYFLASTLFILLALVLGIGRILNAIQWHFSLMEKRRQSAGVYRKAIFRRSFQKAVDGLHLINASGFSSLSRVERVRSEIDLCRRRAEALAFDIGVDDPDRKALTEFTIATDLLIADVEWFIVLAQGSSSVADRERVVADVNATAQQFNARAADVLRLF